MVLSLITNQTKFSHERKLIQIMSWTVNLKKKIASRHVIKVLIGDVHLISFSFGSHY